jgi:TP901 family phage tail tape measure protein
VAQATVIIKIDSQSQGAVAGLNATSQSLQNVQKQGRAAASAAGQFGSAMQLLTTPLATFGVGLRQIGQALQGVSFLMTAFVSVPIAAGFRAIAKEAVNFDAALIGAQKTTDLTDAQVGRLSATAGTLSGELRKLAQNVATPLGVLGELAEQAGQLGVRGVGNIMKFVRVAEIMGQTTDIAATEALETFGRLANALGVETNQAGEYILQLANVINMLENTTTASASKIADSMSNAISAASGFNIAGADLAAFVASLYDMGVGAKEAGTMFTRMASYVTTRVHDLAAMTNMSVGEIRQAFDRDFVGGLLGVIKAIGDVESASEQMAIATELFGQRAARGVILLANQYDDLLIPTLERARQEFESGASLVDEYVKAMMSTQAQLGVLQNNLKVLAVSIGDALLPVVNTLLKYVVPAIQIATEAFAALPQKTKVLALAGAALLAVLGPITMIFGTLLFGLGIAITGVLNLAAAFGGAAASIAPFVTGIAAVVAALVGLALIAENAMAGVRDVILDYAAAARTWGSNLVGNIAAGMLQGMAAVINAAIAIANAIARFFRSFSPPRFGPLRDILQWGTNLIDTFIAGFKKADFNAISEITNTIGRYFRDMARLKLIDESAVVPAILAVRHAFTELMAVFNETGKVSEELISRVTANMGEMGDKVAEWLRLQLRVNVAQKAYDDAIDKLREIRALREQINRTYDKEVRAITKSGAPLLDQLSSIVDARAVRDDQLADLDEQEAAQEEIADTAEKELKVSRELLETQAGLIDYYLDELDLLAQHDELMGRIAKSAGSAAGSAGEFAGALDGIDFGGIGSFEETIRGWDDLTAGLDLAIKQFADGRKVIEAFFKGLRGEQVAPDDVMEQGLSLERILGSQEAAGAYEFGIKVKGVWDGFIEGLDDVKSAIGDVVDEIQRLGDNIERVQVPENVVKFFETLVGLLPTIIGVAAGFAIFVLLFKTFGTTLAGLAGFENILAGIFGAGATLKGFGAAVMVAVGNIAAFLQLAAPFIAKFFVIGAIVGAVVTAILQNLGWFKDLFTETWTALVETANASGLGEAIAALGAAFVDLGAVVGPIIMFIWKLLVGLATIIIQTLAGTLAAIIPSLVTIITGAVNILAGFIGTIANVFRAIWALMTGDMDGFKTYLSAGIAQFARLLQGIAQVVAGAIMAVLSAALGLVVNFIAAIWNVLVGGAENIAPQVVATFRDIAVGVNEWIGQAKDWVVEKVTGLWNALGPVLQAIGIDFKGLETEVANASEGIGGTVQTLGSHASGVESAFALPLENAAGHWQTLAGTADGAGETMIGVMGNIGSHASGLEGQIGGPLDNILGQWGNFGTEVGQLGGSVQTGLGEASDAFWALGVRGDDTATEVGAATMGIGTSVEDLAKTFDINIGDINTLWQDLGKESGDTQSDVSGYLDVLNTDLGTHASTKDTELSASETAWGSFKDEVLRVKDLVAGYMEDIALDHVDLKDDIVEMTALMGNAWASFETVVRGVMTNVGAWIDDMNQRLSDLYDDSVGNSYIPDMARGIEYWFSRMTSRTSAMVEDWAGGLNADMSGMSAMTPMYAPTDTALAPNGPLIEIGSINVPSAAVGRAFADQLASELSRFSLGRTTRR